ncbi:ImmA/IrrE family metallo-endopeptidase [Rhodococcus opacus]|nr:ImmA/IrrE family metallo-endopeptidase [Rhodococcus opacus]
MLCTRQRAARVLTPDRADDVYRHRSTAAHEFGHLVMRRDCVPGDPHQEREAGAFAAEFLTPKAIRERDPFSAAIGSRWGKENGLTLEGVGIKASDLPRLRLLLGEGDTRPSLQLVVHSGQLD